MKPNERVLVIDSCWGCPHCDGRFQPPECTEEGRTLLSKTGNIPPWCPLDKPSVEKPIVETEYTAEFNRLANAIGKSARDCAKEIEELAGILKARAASGKVVVKHVSK